MCQNKLYTVLYTVLFYLVAEPISQEELQPFLDALVKK